MRLATLALAHKGWLSEQPFGDGPSWHPLLGVAEEVGELCHAHLKAQQNIRGSAEDLRAQQEDAVGDIVIYLVDYCNRERLDIEACIQNAWAEVSCRDWGQGKHGSS